MNLIQNTAGANEGRMPAILHPADHEAWLHGAPEQAFACLMLWELFYQHPEFGAYLLRLIVHRSISKGDADGPPSIFKV